MKRTMPPAPPRRRGRPSAQTTPGGDAAVRDHLLQAALELFAAQGIAATPLTQIARRAGVTPALLHYYFGSREKLIEALVEERLLPLTRQLAQSLAGDAGSLREAVEKLVAGLIAVLSANAWFPQLWVREVLSEGGHLRDLIVQRMAPLIAHRLRDLVAAAQARGEINPDLDPRLFMVSLIGLTAFPIAAQPVWRSIFPADDITPDLLRRHVLALLLHGMDPRPAAHEPDPNR